MLTMPTAERLASGAYSDHVNPQWVKLLRLLEMNLSYERCVGTELFTADGLRILDFLSGYCVHNAGHNHPAIVSALKEELDKSGPVMLQSNASELAGELAERLCHLAGGGLSKVFFASSGSEGVETAIKFARADTGRVALLSTDRAFHGLTCGALSLMNGELYQGCVALVGDASGTVDAITGEGLCLSFRQAEVLAECFAAGNLERYQQLHRALARRPTLMARLMLTLDWKTSFRQRVMRAFGSD